MSYKRAMDTWATIKGELYCGECQKKHKVGWFQERNKDDKEVIQENKQTVVSNPRRDKRQRAEGLK